MGSIKGFMLKAVQSAFTCKKGISEHNLIRLFTRLTLRYVILRAGPCTLGFMRDELNVETERLHHRPKKAIGPTVGWKRGKEKKSPVGPLALRRNNPHII